MPPPGEIRIIAGEARGRKILAPRDTSTRPLLDRIRASLFTRLEGSFEGAPVLDLFAGVGSFGLEALSRGAREMVFVERGEAALEILKRNVESLGFQSRSTILRGDALRVPDLGAARSPAFSLIFLDPPFSFFDRDEDAGKVLARVREARGSPAVEKDARVILRVPATYQPAQWEEAGGSPSRSWTYGESVVHVFERQGGKEPANIESGISNSE